MAKLSCNATYIKNENDEIISPVTSENSIICYGNVSSNSMSNYCTGINDHVMTSYQSGFKNYYTLKEVLDFFISDLKGFGSVYMPVGSLMLHAALKPNPRYHG